MKVEVEKSSETKFRDLQIGECFEVNGEIYIKALYNLAECAINLRTGNAWNIPSSVSVNPRKLKVVVDDD